MNLWVFIKCGGFVDEVSGYFPKGILFQYIWLSLRLPNQSDLRPVRTSSVN